MSEFKEEQLKKKVRPENIQSMDLFQYREMLGTLQDTGLGCLNQSGWLITNENGSKNWISEKQWQKLNEWHEWCGI